jgi:anti-sigma factor RsiW
MSVSEPYDDRLMADLAAAADGTLPPARAQELEAMAERDPALASALDDQRRALTLIRGAASEVRAPLALRERLEADRARLARPRARRRWFQVATAGALAAAVLLAVVLVTPGAPTVDEAAAFAAEGPTAPAPAAEGKLLAADQDGVAFPEWDAKFGWRATGSHTGEIDGRAATTVYYENAEGRTLAYTIVGGDALDPPGDARTIEAEGTPVEIFRTSGGTPAATWEREGHTCVLSGEGVPDAKLAELAGWKGMGDVAF